MGQEFRSEKTEKQTMDKILSNKGSTDVEVKFHLLQMRDRWPEGLLQLCKGWPWGIYRNGGLLFIQRTHYNKCEKTRQLEDKLHVSAQRGKK